MPIIAITGATGYVGRFVVPELHRRGFGIRALIRPESDRGGFNVPIDWISGDLRSDNLTFDRLTNGADIVIHLAYEHVPGRYRGGEGSDLSGWLDANLNGSLRLLQSAQKADVKLFIFLSSRAVFSHTEPGRVLDESHPVSPDSFYGAYKAAVESFMTAASHQSGLRTCSLRATGVYGLIWPPARSKWWAIVQAVLHDADISAFNGGGTEIYGGDVARLIGLIASDSTQADQEWPRTDIIHLSDLYVTQRDIVQIARKLSGHPGDLPIAPDDPSANPLVCRRLAELAFTLGGQAALKNAIADLIRAAESIGGSSA